MQLFLFLCLVLLSPPGASLYRHHSREVKNRVKDLHVGDMVAPSSRKDFTFDLYRALAATAPSQNVVFSPVSVSMSLAMLSLGAGSSTKTQILEGLGLNLQEGSEEELHRGFQQLLQELNQPRDGFQLSLGNALFTDPVMDVRDTFLSAMKTMYLSDTFPTNFRDSVGALKQINDYVAKQTKGKIVDLLKNLDSNAVMVMVNYIFFKAKWKTPFDPRDTFESRFYFSKRKWVKVLMMSLEDLATPYLRDKELSCTVLELRYTGNASALFILPDRDKMEEVEAMLLPETLKRWRDSMKIRWIDELYLPKFSISGDYNVEHLLPQLGINEVFTSKADLSGITGARNLQVSQVVHKAVLDVSEEGTEASAATGVQITLLSAKMGPKTIVRFNMPFLVIVARTDTPSILFMSKVTNPKQA
uniref:Serpin domain-containing protein n=1 Tax=Callithrix jacchus TaxID=9483 RepID=A0A8I3WBW6_CALJA